MDFMASYGIALIVIIVAVAVIYIISNSSNDLFQQSCTGYSGFSCSSMFLDSNGVLTLTISQATGGQILINGAACASTASTNGDMPEYGNTGVFNSLYYYPNSEFANGVFINTGSSAKLTLYCYGSSGVAVSQTTSAQYVGYIWLNYTIVNTNIKTTQLIAAINAQYT